MIVQLGDTWHCTVQVSAVSSQRPEQSYRKLYRPKYAVKLKFKSHSESTTNKQGPSRQKSKFTPIILKFVDLSG